MKRALVSLPDELFDLMRTKLKGRFGQNDSEIIRGIVIAYLSEQGYLKNESPSEETEIQSEMIGAIVDTLEEKGIATPREIDKKIRVKLEAKRRLAKIQELK
jgi:metal-responsive CopG/Arc/MetJ family transcriptional regulator